MLALRLPFVLNSSLTCNKSLATKPRESISMVILLSGGSNKNAFFVELILLRWPKVDSRRLFFDWMPCVIATFCDDFKNWIPWLESSPWTVERGSNQGGIVSNLKVTQSLEVQPPFFYSLVYEPPSYYSTGLSSSKRNHHFKDGGWLPVIIIMHLFLFTCFV